VNGEFQIADLLMIGVGGPCRTSQLSAINNQSIALSLLGRIPTTSSS
jgi:hypothetical protein